MGDPQKIHHFKLSTGDPARVPDSELDEFMEVMDADGITYEELPDDAPIDHPRVPADGTPAVIDVFRPGEPAPEVGPRAPRRGRPTQEQFDLDVDDDDAGVDPAFVGDDEEDAGGPPPYVPSRAPGVTVTREATPPPYAPSSQPRDPFYEPDTTGPWQENALDGLMGFAHGATLGGGDELAGLADDAGLYDAIGLDLGPDGVQGPYREEDKLARERSPLSYHLAEGAAGTPMAIGAGSLGLAGSTGLGMVQGALSSDAPDFAGRASGAARGGFMGALLHGTGEGLAATSAAASKARPLLQGASNEARNAVFGEPGDFRRLADKRGLDYAFDGPAEIVRERGLTNRVMPQSARDYANKAKPIKDAEGRALGTNLEIAGKDLSTHTHKDLADDLVANLDVPPLPPRGPDATAGLLADESLGHQPDFGGLPKHLQQPSMAGELLTQERLARSGTEQGSKLANQYGKLRGRLSELPGPMLPPKELNELKSAYYDEAYDAQAGSQPDTIAETAASNAGRSANKLLRGALSQHPDPSHLTDYNRQAESFGEIALIEQMARNKAAGTQGQAAGGGLWTALSAPVTRPVKQYGNDLTANLTQLGANAAGATSSALTPGRTDAARTLARGAAAPVEAEAGRATDEGPPPNSQAMRGMGFYAGTPTGSDQGQQRGLDLAGSVLRVLEDRPQVLGAFADKLKALAASPDPSALNAELTRLVQTNPAFRMHVLPQL